MTLTEAKKLRDRGRVLIGQTGIEFQIIDVIVIPDDSVGAFMDHYRRYQDTISNDNMIVGFSSKSYSVHVIYEIGVNVIGEDISTYKDRLN